MMEAIEEGVESLSMQPYRGSSARDDRLYSIGYRILMVKNCGIFFTVDDKTLTVDIERILYARCDWLRLL
jgi:plasmid stabilization system protein ParE